jgi:uncharacterized membrane protein
MEMIQGAEYGDFWNMAETVWLRLLNRDILLISFIILFIVLEKLILKKSKDRNILKQVILYVLGYVGVISLFYLYSWIASWFMPVYYPPLIDFAFNNIIGYILVVIVLNIKIYFKAKEKKTHRTPLSVQDMDNSLAMLKALFDRGILTQEEFDHKKEKLLSM